MNRFDFRGRGAARAEDAQGTPTQSHISPSILVYEEQIEMIKSVIRQIENGQALLEYLYESAKLAGSKYFDVGERIFIELTTSDRTLKASREGSK